MLISEMHDQFLQYLDKQSNFSAPEVTPEEIDIYFNTVQHQFIELLIEEGIEKNQEYLDYVKNIILPYTTTPLSNTPTNKPNGQYVDLPTQYRTSLLEEVTIAYLDCNNVSKTDRIPVIPMTRDEYNKAIKNPFKTPWKEEILRIVSSGNKFELIGFPGCTITKYFIDYIKEPDLMRYGTQYSTVTTDIQCELNEAAQIKIIEMAVKKALKTLGDERIGLEKLEKIIKTIE